jgi:hypothetical protein
VGVFEFLEFQMRQFGGAICAGIMCVISCVVLIRLG